MWKSEAGSAFQSVQATGMSERVPFGNITRTRRTPRRRMLVPLLANVFLHYALDLWVHQWRRRHARGRVSIVRYADDFVVGFESAADARRMLADLKERLARFGLLLHEDKTRLIEFGRLPAMARQQRGARRP